MNILFAGTPAIAVPSLEAIAALADEGDFCRLAGVLTNPDAARGRHGCAVPSDVGMAASRIAGWLPPFAVIKSDSFDEDCLRGARDCGAGLLVTFAYGVVFPPEFLALFPMGGINIHPSLLPKYRGATPIPAAIMNRDSETGITIQRLAPELDSGSILLQETIPLNGKETCASLSAVVAERGAALLVRTLRALAENDAVAETPQNHALATFCDKLERKDGLIDWRFGASAIDARIRAFTPWPLSYTRHGEAELYILEAAPYNGPVGAGGTADAGEVLGFDRNAGIVIQTGDGLLAASRLQYRTRKVLDWRSFLNGARNFIGAVLR
ncbi:MAG: methionyl-tRNA formyltransferase [Spirochaetaceae bacterium]|jgi:methionyl-tRNA formyltransferase|nr:methionyl-tRNA formyltransferase [Spirochaetaceae bacterium]